MFFLDLFLIRLTVEPIGMLLPVVKDCLVSFLLFFTCFSGKYEVVFIAFSVFHTWKGYRCTVDS